VTARAIIAAVVVAALLAGGAFFWHRRVAPTEQAVQPPPQPAAPVAETVPLPAPRLWKLTTEVGCLAAEAFRYEQADAKLFGHWKPIGVLVANQCAEPRVFTDIKTSMTAREYVSSHLPQRVVLLKDAAARVVSLSRGGRICTSGEPLPEACREVPVAPGEQIFFEVADQTWFSLRLAGDKRIEGFFGFPQDPTKPRPISKMPEMGFGLESKKR